MCSDTPEAGPLPPAVAAMLDEYRALHAEQPHDWGRERMAGEQAAAYARWLGVELLLAQVDADWPRPCAAASPTRSPPG